MRIAFTRTVLTTLLAAALFLGSLPALAQFTVFQPADLVPSTHYYSEMIGGGLGTPIAMSGGDQVGSERSNDGFYGPIKLGFPIAFFGKTYTELWANVNGNITFEAGSSAALPPTPPGISVFFADADTRPTTSGLMWLRQEPKRTIITWDRVGYASSHADKVNSFQLVLYAPDAVPPGEGQIGFFFKDMGWETGDAQGGTGGSGPMPPAATSAAVGMGDGVSRGYVLWGSTYPGIASTVANRHVWFDVDSAGMPVLAPVKTFVPAAAHTSGSAGTNWATDVVIQNTGAAQATFTITPLASGPDNTAAVALQGETIEAGGSLAMTDVIGTKLGANAWRGALLLSSASRDLRMITRTYNTTTAGTYGQTIPALSSDDAIAAGEKGQLLGVSETEAYRTNVGFVNPTMKTITVTAKLFSATGSALGERTYSIPPLGHLQEDRIFATATSASVAFGRIEVTTTGGPVFAYASMVDARTGAPSFILPVR